MDASVNQGEGGMTIDEALGHVPETHVERVLPPKSARLSRNGSNQFAVVHEVNGANLSGWHNDPRVAVAHYIVNGGATIEPVELDPGPQPTVLNPAPGSEAAHGAGTTVFRGETSKPPKSGSKSKKGK